MPSGPRNAKDKKRNKKSRKQNKGVSLDVLQANNTTQANTPGTSTSMSKRRMWSLIIVHLLIAAHILHFEITGSTVTPIEPSETTFSIRTGAINAGAIFFVVTILATIVLGRFFCGWACHIVALQDFARWMLYKIKIKPRPVRMRVAFLFPLFAAFWLYAKPAIERAMAQDASSLSWHLATTDFWKTFPGPFMTLFTFAVCGFLIIYFLGSKGFCTYGCPYGFFYGIADKVAPGKIRVTDACDGSAQCTIHCTSNVDVAREVAAYGEVVDPGCMKCMDCVSICPNDALYFGFSPSIEKPRKADQAPKRHYDFPLKFELLFVLFWAFSFVSLFRLYNSLPLLLAIGLSSIFSYQFIVLVNNASNARIQNAKLKIAGDLTIWGKMHRAACAIMIVFLVHSATMQYYKFIGAREFDAAARILDPQQANDAPGQDSTTYADAIQHAKQAQHALGKCHKWGLFHMQGLGRMMGQIAQWLDKPNEALTYYQLDTSRNTVNPATWFYLGELLAKSNQAQKATHAFEQVINREFVRRDTFLNVANWFGKLGQHEKQWQTLQSASNAYPADGQVAIELCKVLVQSPDTSLRSMPKAITVAENTLYECEFQHADLLSMVAWLYAQTGRLDEAVASAEMSLERAQENGEIELAATMKAMVREYKQQRDQLNP